MRSKICKECGSKFTPEASSQHWCSLLCRFESKVIKGSGCWIWTGSIGGDGYGQISVSNNGIEKNIQAHRLAFELYVRKPKKDKLICHTCDEPLCQKREHLFEGTHDDNMRDMVRKGRQAKGDKSGRYTKPERTARGDRHGRYTKPECTARGEGHSSAKLTEGLACEILLYKQEGCKPTEIATFMKVPTGTVKSVFYGRSWAHI